LKSLVKIFLSFSLLFFLFYKTKYEELIDNILSFSFLTMVYVGPLYFLSLLVSVFKWRLLLPLHDFRSLLFVSLIGQFYSTVLPGQIAGEIAKVFYLGKSQDDSEQVAASVIVDKLTGVLGLLIVASGGAITSSYQVPIVIPLSLVVFTIIFLIILFFLKLPIAYQVIVKIIRQTALRCPRFNQFMLQVIRILDVWAQFLANPFRLIYVFFLGASFQVICIWINILLAQDLGIKIPFSEWCWIFGLVSIAVLFPISIGGIGVREGVFAGVLSLQGVPVEKSIALSFAVFGVSLIGALIGGGLEVFRVVRSSSFSRKA
jgi:uncharacterized protein (TIRG00374 family)